MCNSQYFVTVTAVQGKKKKPLAQVIAEKEEKKRKELEEKMKEVSIAVLFQIFFFLYIYWMN